MSEIELDPDTKQEIVGRIQQYMLDELQLEIGGFDAQFLLDYFGEQMGCYYYNQGLADALITYFAMVFQPKHFQSKHLPSKHF